MPRPQPTRFKLQVPQELLDLLPAAAELYMLIWPGPPPALVLTVLPDRQTRFVPSNYRQLPATLLLGPPRRAGGHWQEAPGP